MSVYKRPRSPFFWCKFRVNGKLYQRSTDKISKREAQAVERLFRSEIESQPGFATARGASEVQPGAAGEGSAQGESELDVLLKADRQATEANGVRAGTLRGLDYAHDRIREFFRGIKDPAARHIDFETCTEFVASRRKSGARGQSIVRELQCLKRLTRAARRRGWIAREPIDWPKVKRNPPDLNRSGKLIPVPDLQRWLAALPTQDARDYAGLLMATGLRREELGRLQFRDVRGEALILRDEATKTGARTIPLPELARNILERREMEAGDTPYVFPRHIGKRTGLDTTVEFNATFRRTAMELGIQNIHPRDLRHTFISLAAKHDPVAAMRIAGHKDLKMTEKYSHSTKVWMEQASSVASKQLFLESGYTTLATLTKAEGNLGRKYLSKRWESQGK